MILHLLLQPLVKWNVSSAIDDSVLKYLTVKISDAITAEGISAAQAEAESKAQIFEDETESAETQTESTDSEKTKEASTVQADTVEDSK